MTQHDVVEAKNEYAFRVRHWDDDTNREVRSDLICPVYWPERNLDAGRFARFTVEPQKLPVSFNEQREEPHHRVIEWIAIHTGGKWSLVHCNPDETERHPWFDYSFEKHGDALLFALRWT